MEGIDFAGYNFDHFDTNNEDSCEMRLLSPCANPAWNEQGRAPPMLFAPMGIAPMLPDNWDCPPEKPTPPTYADLFPRQDLTEGLPLADHPFMPPALAFIATEDPRITLSRNMAEHFRFSLRYKKQLDVEIVEGKDLTGSNLMCAWNFAGNNGQTPIVPTCNPSWFSHFQCTITNKTENELVKIVVKNRSKGLLRNSIIGSFTIDPNEMIEDFQYDQWFRISRKSNEEVRCRFALTPPILDNFVFTLKQTAFSFANYTITEENGNTIFGVESESFDLVLRDVMGNRVLDLIKLVSGRKLFEIEPIFEIYVPGTDTLLATISRKCTLLRMEFFVEIAGERLQINRDSTVTLRQEDGEFAASFKPPAFLFKSFSMEIAPYQNVPLMLAIAVIMDHADSQVCD